LEVEQQHLQLRPKGFLHALPMAFITFTSFGIFAILAVEICAQEVFSMPLTPPGFSENRPVREKLQQVAQAQSEHNTQQVPRSMHANE
jgi:hypothetical protein